jgi:hypothetical protein
MRKALENNEQWVQLFFLVHLSNGEPRKNKGTLVQNKFKVKCFLGTNQTSKNHY